MCQFLAIAYDLLAYTLSVASILAYDWYSNITDKAWPRVADGPDIKSKRPVMPQNLKYNVLIIQKC